MKILEIKSLAIPDIKVIRFARFTDPRGYFTETYRLSDFEALDFMKGLRFVQCNESFSKAGTLRGFHYQWEPAMGKLVRTVSGRMIDFVMDIRLGSPYFGKIIGYDMPAKPEQAENEWIWVPPGFAHGNCFTKPTTIQYFCTGQYNGAGEAGISPFSPDIDWSLCDKKIKGVFDRTRKGNLLMTDKDKNGFSVQAWKEDRRSGNFRI